MSSDHSENIDYARTINVSRAHAAAREKGEHISDSVPLSLWSVLGLGLVVLCAGAYFGANGKGTSPNLKGWVYEPDMPEGAGAAAEVDPRSRPAWIAEGKKIYAGCAGCHGPGGEGQGVVFPPLKGSEFVIHGEKRLAAILAHGINGALVVNGKPFNGVMMPRGGGALNDTQVAQVLSYIRNEWGNSGSIIYEDQYAAFKAENPRSGPYSEAELRAIPQDENLPPSKFAPAPAAGAPADGAAAPAAK